MKRSKTRFPDSVLTGIGELMWPFINEQECAGRPDSEKIREHLPHFVGYPERLNRSDIVWIAINTNGAWLSDRWGKNPGIYFELESDAIMFKLAMT